jgi:hypothetical protein
MRSTGTTCKVIAAQAEHVATGIYRVILSAAGETPAACAGPLPAADAAVIVTVRSDAAETLLANYRPVCDASLSDHLVDEVHITDTSGTPTDATFAVELINAGGVPSP